MLCNALYVIRDFLCNLFAGHLLNQGPDLIPVIWKKVKWRGTDRFAGFGLLAAWDGVVLEARKVNQGSCEFDGSRSMPISKKVFPFSLKREKQSWVCSSEDQV